MTQLVPSSYDSIEGRLALGLELIDAARDDRMALPISVALDGAPLPLPRGRAGGRAFGFPIDDVLPRVDRHDSCLHAIVYRKGLYRAGKKTTVELRFLCPARRFVPRRIQFPLVDPDHLDPPTPDADAATLAALRAQRSRRVALFPGAAYDVGGAVTALRGRVRRGAAPLRWARVEARLPPAPDSTPGPLVGVAHGDDRGEFFLLLGAIPGPQPAPSSLARTVEVTVFARPADLLASDWEKGRDPLWDLPLEQVFAPGPADPVSTGDVLPTGYTATRAQTVMFQLGTTLSSEITPFVF